MGPPAAAAATATAATYVACRTRCNSQEVQELIVSIVVLTLIAFCATTVTSEVPTDAACRT